MNGFSSQSAAPGWRHNSFDQRHRNSAELNHAQGHRTKDK